MTTDKPKLFTGYSRRPSPTSEVLFVPLLVALETVWVLEYVYEIPRKEIQDSINDLLSMPILEFEAQPAVQSSVSSA